MARQPEGRRNWNEVLLPRGIDRLHCMVCRTPIVERGEGLAADLCAHVVLVRDWSGEYTHVRASLQGKLDNLLEQVTDGERLERGITKLLPKTAFVLHMVRPEYAQDPGEDLLVAIDLNGVQPRSR